jgi:sugar O-acyltransferase (sialic acid O-acetyltransferase NeuD family)
MKIILHGSGEHARVVLDCLLENNQLVVALFDPKYTESLFGVPQKGAYDPSFEPEAKAIIAIGDNQIRKKVSKFTRHDYTNAIHSSAVISKRAVIGSGNMILHGTVIQAQTVIGNHVIVNTGAQIDHDCKIEDFVHIAPGVILCGTVEIGEGTFVGAGAVVIPGKKIGAWATVGAGAVVIGDIPDYAVAVGNPARIIKYNKP